MGSKPLQISSPPRFSSSATRSCPGRTKDKNIGYIAEYLTDIGIDLKEVRVVPDEEPEIVAALNALRARYTYVFTTGGIGPTHDDITAESVAKAFGVAIGHHPRAVEIMRARLRQTGGVMNEARMRMTRIPAGAELVLNKVSAAPGFWIGNVIVMAGVPSVMQAMLEYVTPKLKTGAKMLSEPCAPTAAKATSAPSLARSPKQHPDVVIGSYPFMDENNAANTHVVVRSRDPQKLAAAKAGGRGDAGACEGGACGRESVTALFGGIAKRRLTTDVRSGAIAIVIGHSSHACARIANNMNCAA